MREVTFDTPVLKVESLKSKFDTNVLSNSFVTLLDNNYIEARILQQLHYWSYSQYGVVIDGIRWIYKPLREWLSEALVGLTDWKLRCAIASLLKKGLIKREKLFTKHQIQNGDRFWWQPKNQTYYYSLNYDKLRELIEQVENAESTENVRIENSPKLSVEDFQDTKFCDCPQNNTKNTSIENSTKDKSHPTLPCECEEKLKKNNQRKQKFSNPQPDSSFELEQTQINSLDSKVIEEDITSEHVEEKINEYKDTNEQDVQETVQETEVVQEDVQVASEIKPIVKPKTPKGTKSKRKDQAPWKDEGQFKRFYQALIQALPIVANSHSPQGLAQVIIKQLRCGIPHSYWDDFHAGLPIGTSLKPEWEIEPGVPYPQFIEYLTEKLKRGNNTTTDEATRNEVFRILDKPRQAKAFWGQFKRSVVNVSEQIERDRALGVSNPNTPVWTRERIEPSIEEAATAGKKIMAVNHDVQMKIEAAKNPQLESIEPLPNQLPEPLTKEDAETRGLGDAGIEEDAETRGLGDAGIEEDAETFSSLRVTSHPDSETPHPSPCRAASLTPDPWMDESDNYQDSDEIAEESLPTMSELLAERLGDSNLKGFTKQMPKVSQAEAEAEAKAEIEAIRKPKLARKTHINQMSVAEINNYLQEPILRREITSQLMKSDYELITDELGQIIAVKPSQ